MGEVASTRITRQGEVVETLGILLRDAQKMAARDGVSHLDEVLAGQFCGSLKHIDLHESRQRNEELAYKFFNFLVTALTPAKLEIHQKALKFCRDNVPSFKAMNEATNVGGGALVPAEFDRMLIRLIEKFGVFRANARTRLMSRDLRTIPRRTGGVTVGWVVEGSTITASQPAYDNVALAAKKLMGLCVASSELQEDAAISLADELAFEIGYAFAQAEDLAGFIGDASPTYGNVTGVTTKLKGLSTTISDVAGLKLASGNVFSEFLLQDFLDTAALLPAFADGPNAAWYCHKLFFFGTMLRVALVGAAGVPVGGAVAMGADGRPVYLGYPVNFTQVMPKTDANSQIAALLGDLSLSSTLGDRRARTLFTDPYSLSGSDSVQYRLTERVDLVTHDVGNATSVAADKQPGPVVGLISAAS